MRTPPRPCARLLPVTGPGRTARYGRALLLLATALFAAACADVTSPRPAEPEAPSLAATAAVPVMARSRMLVEHTVREPCTGSLVDLSGWLQLQRRVRVLDADRREIRYTAETTRVTAVARSAPLTFRVEGAASGVLVAAHRERAATAADFRVVVTSPPGAETGRAEVAPRFGVRIAFPVAADGTLRDPVIDEVFFPKGECGSSPGP